MIAPVTLQDLRARRKEILDVAGRHGAEDVRVFGSVVRGTTDAESDLDFLVRFREGTSLLDQVALIQDLEDLLGREVDVVSEPALHWFIRSEVISEAVPL